MLHADGRMFSFIKKKNALFLTMGIQLLFSQEPSSWCLNLFLSFTIGIFTYTFTVHLPGTDAENVVFCLYIMDYKWVQSN